MSNENRDFEAWLCAYCGDEVHLSDIDVSTSETGQEYASKCCMGYIVGEDNKLIPADEIAEALGRRGE